MPGEIDPSDTLKEHVDDADAAILMFDLQSPSTLDSIPLWYGMVIMSIRTSSLSLTDTPKTSSPQNAEISRSPCVATKQTSLIGDWVLDQLLSTEKRASSTTIYLSKKATI